jgi:hypothetical protein
MIIALTLSAQCKMAESQQSTRDVFFWWHRFRRIIRELIFRDRQSLLGRSNMRLHLLQSLFERCNSLPQIGVLLLCRYQPVEEKLQKVVLRNEATGYLMPFVAACTPFDKLRNWFDEDSQSRLPSGHILGQPRLMQLEHGTYTVDVDKCPEERCCG